MKRRSTVGLMLLMAAAASPAADINDPDAVVHLRAVHNALGNASQAITACANAGGDRSDGYCQQQDRVHEMHSAVRKRVNAHPEIGKHSTVRFRNADGEVIHQNIPALILQAENPRTCP